MLQRKVQTSALFALLGGLLLSVWLAQWAAHIGEDESRQAFDRYAEANHRQMREALNTFEETLRGLQGFFAGSDAVDRDEFRRYVARLDLPTRYPGIQVIGFAREVAHADRAPYLAAVRGDRRVDPAGYPDFGIHPPGERSRYLVIEYIEPMARNRAAFGFDLASEGERRQAADRARDEQKPAATAPVTLVQETGRQAGFLLLLPIYRNDAALDSVAARRAAFVGVVYAAFRMEDLAHAVFGDDLRHFGLSINDLGRAGHPADTPKSLLHLPAPAAEEKGATRRSDVRIDFAGRHWQFVVETALFAPSSISAPGFILGGGALISLLLGILLQSAGSARRRAVEMADEMTQELRASETRVRAVLDHTLDAIVTIDEHGLIEDFNFAAERLFGRKASEVQGQNVKLLMPEPYTSAHDGYLKSYRDTGVRKIIGIGREVEGRRADGTCFPMELAVTEMVVHGRRRFIGLVRDITERKRTEAALLELNRRLDLAAASAGLGVWDWDIASNALVWDARMYALYGLRAGDFSGAYAAWESAIHPDDRERTVAALTQAVAGGPRYDTEFRIRVGNEIRYIKANGLVVRDETGAPLRMIGVNYDISERKEIERLKSEFVSTVSHELRTPLTSIRGSLGLVEGGIAGELPAQAKALVHIAAMNCDRLVRLINEILDMEKIESGKMRFDLQTQALMPLVEHVVDANQGFATQHGTHYTIVARQDDAHVRVDTDRFAQVLTNLLSNAAKYSPQGSPVDIEVSRQDGDLRIAVRDHGAGIPPEFQGRVFEKFSQADGSTTREKGGSGLGLSIARAMVERMGGRIGFDSRAGEGSCFWFCLPEAGGSDALPIRPGPEPAKSPLPPATAGVGARPRILHVEDDADLGQFVAALLADLAEVVLAPGLAEGRNALTSSATDAALADRYALLILDPGLPDGSGFDLLPTVRALPYRLPVIVFSASEADSNLAGDGEISAVLVKSRTSNERLLQIVRALTTHPSPSLPADGNECLTGRGMYAVATASANVKDLP